MNIIYIILIETIVIGLIAHNLSNYILLKTNSKEYYILNYFIWGSFYLISLLLNLDKFVLSFGLLLISCLLLTAFFYKHIELNVSGKILFWLLFLCSIFTISGIIISKKMTYTLINKDAYDGLKGEEGSIGNEGDTYLNITEEQKCYSHLINTAEDFLRSVKRENGIVFDVKENQLNNSYFKNILKKYCSDKCYK